MSYNILVCDDDPDIRAALTIYLSQEGYHVLQVSDGLQALDVLSSRQVHLILMDVMMPELDGIWTTVRIREQNNIPIIMLSAKSEDTDKILGLNMGADDYVTKPFNPIELLARVKSQLRRYATLGGIKGEPSKGVYQTGGLVLDDNARRVTVDGEDVSLTPIEYNILKLLITDIDRVFSSKQIYEQVWEEPAFHVGKIISVHIRHLREKIEINPNEPQYVKVVYGLGYKIVSVKR